MIVYKNKFDTTSLAKRKVWTSPLCSAFSQTLCIMKAKYGKTLRILRMDVSNILSNT